MVAGSWRAADAIAELTSCAAASMSRSSANTMVIRGPRRALTEGVPALPGTLAHVGDGALPDDVDVLASGPVLHRRRGNDDRVGLVVEAQGHADELARPQRGLDVREPRAQANGAGARIDGVVDEDE